MMHPKNEQQIQAATGLPEYHWPEGFMSEYMTQLRLYHRLHSGGGPLPPELLIPLMRQFDMKPPNGKAAKPERTRWDQIPRGAKVQVVIGGTRKTGTFQQRVSGGTIAVKLDDHPRVLELPPSEVKLDDSIPKDVRQSTMKDDYSEPAPTKAKKLDRATPTLPVLDWKTVKIGSPVEVDGKAGTLVGPTPKRRMKLTVEVDGEMGEYPSNSVTRVDSKAVELKS